MTNHARLSPSGSHRWLNCAAALRMEKDYPGSGSSEFAAEGSAAHLLGEECLRYGCAPSEYINRTILVSDSEAVFESDVKDSLDFDPLAYAYKFVVDQDMADNVNIYVESVRSIAGDDAMYFGVEERVEFSHVVEVENQFGTSDTVIITADGELQVHDLKFGRGEIEYATNNTQLMLYALGALHKLELAYDINSVRLFIHQPRLNHFSEWACELDYLLDFASVAKEGARETNKYFELVDVTEIPDEAYAPGVKTCRWCKHKGNCKALADFVKETIQSDFDDISELEIDFVSDPVLELSAKMKAVDLVEIWCNGVRAEVERRIFNGDHVPGYKLVQGRKGHRAWTHDEEQIAKMLKKYKLKADDIYTKKLVSPTTVESFKKSGKLAPLDWDKVNRFIKQPEGKPSVAPDYDKRPAIELAKVDASDFNAVDE